MTFRPAFHMSVAYHRGMFGTDCSREECQDPQHIDAYRFYCQNPHCTNEAHVAPVVYTCANCGADVNEDDLCPCYEAYFRGEGDEFVTVDATPANWDDYWRMVAGNAACGFGAVSDDEAEAVESFYLTGRMIA